MFNLNESHFWGAFKLTMRRPPKHASFISNISFKLKPQYTSTKQILAMPGFWEILLAPPFPQCTNTLICHLTNWLGSDKLNPFQICMPVISLPSSYSYFSCSGSSSQRKFDFKAVLPIYINLTAKLWQIKQLWWQVCSESIYLLYYCSRDIFWVH